MHQSWAAAGGTRGALAPFEFDKMTSYAAFLQNTLKFSLAPSALVLDTLYFSLKRREKTQKFSLAPSARRKMVNFLYGAENASTFLSVGGFAPLWKNICGRPWLIFPTLIAF